MGRIAFKILALEIVNGFLFLFRATASLLELVSLCATALLLERFY